MRHSIRKLSRGIFGTLMIGALGFGARQALATPMEPEGRVACRREEQAACNVECQALLGDGWRGECRVNVYDEKECNCYPFP